ncbi:NMD3 [Hepatospora eriocheir]|uniref:60S ribosomal export protein NMD3 n=1 Tax=Hepatospora eriocheir TaxID=1081669 RepID=A0A1X0QHX1_9MICR|nr:NMD3 [Hepatospora eriocheir]
MEILCCNCGIEIEFNNKNMCSNCIYTSSNLLQKIDKTTIIETCRGCERYHMPPSSWRHLQLGSHELLIHCLNKNRSAKTLNITDSNFIYTEEHSKMLIIEIKILDEGVEYVVNLQFKIRNRQCGDCMRAESKQFWNSVVQLRQHPASKRTFWFVEQLVSNHNAHMETTNIKETKDGIDFFFTKKNSAIKLVKFLTNFFGVQRKDSNRLISEDRRNNTCNNKNTYCIELMPFCKDDLVAIKNKSKYDLFVVNKMNTFCTLTNLKTKKTKLITSKDYFSNKDQYVILQRSKDFIEYEVLVVNRHNKSISITNDNENIIEIQTDMELEVDNKVYCYDLSIKNFPIDCEFDETVLLIRKVPNVPIKLKDGNTPEREYGLFLEDIEQYKDIFESIAEHRETPVENLVKQLNCL